MIWARSVGRCRDTSSGVRRRILRIAGLFHRKRKHSDHIRDRDDGKDRRNEVDVRRIDRNAGIGDSGEAPINCGDLPGPSPARGPYIRYTDTA
jgi:hypothetical protein